MLFFSKHLAIVMLLTSVVSVVWAEQASQDIKIGVIASTTGIAADDGTLVLRSVELAVADYNERNDRKIRLFVEDDGTDAKRSVAAFRKLQLSKVQGIIGCTWNFLTNAVIPLAGQAQIPIISTSSYPDSLDLAVGDGFAFGNYLMVANEVEPLKKYLARETPQSVYLVYVNNGWGELQRDRYVKELRQANVQAIYESTTAGHADNEWSTTVLKVKAKKPELTILIVNKNDINLFLRKSEQLGFHSRFFGGSASLDAYRESMTKQLYSDFCFTYPMEKLRKSQEFIGRFKARYGQEPRMYADNSYDAVAILAEAIAQSRDSNSSVSSILREKKFDGLQQYLYDSKTSLSSGSSSLVCIENGELVVAD